MSNFTKENLVPIPASEVKSGMLAFRIGNEVFIAGGNNAGADVQYGVINENGEFQALDLSGTTPVDSGTPEQSIITVYKTGHPAPEGIVLGNVN